MANTTGEKELKTAWPITKGLTARTNTQTGRLMNLVPEVGSKVTVREAFGIR